MVTPAPRREPFRQKLDSAATPAWIYGVAIAVAVAVGAAAAFPKVLLALVILAVVGAFIVAGARNPWIALGFIVAQYPVMTTLRTIYVAYGLPVFAGGVRFLPDLIQYVIIAQLLLRGIKNPHLRLRIFPDDLPFVVYIALGVYSVFVALAHTHPYGAMNGWYLSISPAIFYLVIRWLRPSSEQGMRFLRWMVTCYCVLMAASLWVHLTHPAWYMTLQNTEHPFYVPAGMNPMFFWSLYPRMQAFLFEENHWGALSELVAVISAAYLVRSPELWKRYLLMLLAAACMIFSLSRGAMLSCCVALVLLLLQGGEHRKRLLVMVAVLGAVGAVMLVVFRDEPLVYVTMSRFDTVSTTALQSGEAAKDRVHQWKAGWEIFAGLPSGMGLGTVGNGAALSFVTPFVVGDSIYVRVLAEQGIPGIGAFLYLIVSIPWVLWRSRRNAPREWRPLGVGLFAFHFGFCIQGIGANTFDYYCVTPVYFMLLALYVTAVHEKMLADKAVATFDATTAPRQIEGYHAA